MVWDNSHILYINNLCSLSFVCLRKVPHLLCPCYGSDSPVCLLFFKPYPLAKQIFLMVLLLLSACIDVLPSLFHQMPLLCPFNSSLCHCSSSYVTAQCSILLCVYGIFPINSPIDFCVKHECL